MAKAETNSLNVRKGRYVSGGSTEVSDDGKRIEWWDRTDFASSKDDMYYTVERKFEGRIDLIAALFLGDSHLWWALAQYNNILDPYSEIKAGAVIAIPSSTRLDEILSGKTGGVASTREIPTTILPIV